MLSRSLAKAVVCAVFALVLSGASFAQDGKSSGKKPAAVGPKVTQIDTEGLKKLLKPNGKPLLINFWATWCDPCREEFPDLVKLDNAYRGKVDFITISLDDLADINTLVPKFLAEVKAQMPAYLLKTADESAAIAMVANDWSGNLPMTALFDASGERAYVRMGKLKYDTVMVEIDKVLSVKPTSSNLSAPELDRLSPLITLFQLPDTSLQYTYEKGVADAEKEIVSGRFKIVKYGLTPGTHPSPKFEALKKKYSLTVSEGGCMVPSAYPQYALGFNKTMRVGFEKKFGKKAAREMGMASDAVE